jgi:hypothetical protein
MSWRSLENGDLLAAAEREKFDVFVTADTRIPATHDIAGWHLAIVVVPTNRRKILDQIASAILDAVIRAKSGAVSTVSLSNITRRPRRPRTR